MSNHYSLKRKFEPNCESQFNLYKKYKQSFANQISLGSSNNSSNQSFESNGFESSANQFSGTVPKPFTFQTELRSRKPSIIPTEDLEIQLIQNRPKFKARPVPKFPSLAEPIRANKHKVPQQFNLSMENKCKESGYSQEPNKFIPRPCPDFSNRFEIKKNEFIPTIPQPFNLQTGARSRECSVSKDLDYKFEALPLPNFYNNCSFELKSKDYVEDSNRFQFIAKPMPNFENVFVPITNSVPTQPLNIELSTSKRAKEREKFEDYLADKENIKREQKNYQNMLEEYEIKNYRKTLEFKARPLQEIKPFYVQRSQEALTTPKSPILSTKARAEQRTSYYKQTSNDMEID